MGFNSVTNWRIDGRTWVSAGEQPQSVVAARSREIGSEALLVKRPQTLLPPAKQASMQEG